MMIKRRGRYRWVLLVPLVVAGTSPLFATPATAAVGMEDEASAREALALVNEERAEAGCGLLRIVPKLQAPAEQQSWDQAARDRFGHDGADGSTAKSRLRGLGYSWWGENVAQFQSAPAVVKFWSNSPAHRANMLNCVFKETGLALARSDSGKLYWTQTFGG